MDLSKKETGWQTSTRINEIEEVHVRLQEDVVPHCVLCQSAAFITLYILLI